jgi:hypothetical protein
MKNPRDFRAIFSCLNNHSNGNDMPHISHSMANIHPPEGIENSKFQISMVMRIPKLFLGFPAF